MKKITLLFLLFTFAFIKVISAEGIIKIELKTDRYGSETTWKVVNTLTNAVVAQGGPYSDGNPTVQNIPDISVDETGCYSFTIYDAYGDGLESTGYYKVYYNGTLVKEGRSFTSFETVLGMGSGCPDNEIILYGINSPFNAGIDKDEYVTGIVKSFGVLPLTSFKVRYKINEGEFSDYYTHTCDINIGESTFFKHDISPELTLGTHNVTVEISSPNGIEDFEPTNDHSKTSSFYVFNTAKRTLLEQFTTEQCGFCPGGAAHIRTVLETRSEIIWVAHHAGYGTDSYTLPASTALLPLYGRTTYAPAAMVNRNRYYSTADEPGPVFSVGKFTALFADERRKEEASVAINIVGTYLPETKELTINITGKILKDISGEALKLTAYILEDGIISTSQAGASGSYTHNNLIRKALSGSTGDDDIILANTAGTEFTKTYTTILAANWVPANLKVVAIVNNWNTSDINDRIAYNAEQKYLSDFPTTLNDESELLTFTFGDKDYAPAVFDSENKTIEVIVNTGTNLSDLKAEFTVSDGSFARVGNALQKSGKTINDFRDPVVYTVYSENTLTKTNWTVHVVERASSVNTDNILSNINIYPNPVNKILNIENAEGANIQLVNLLGQEVISINNASAHCELNVSGLESGTYFVRITNGNDIVNRKVSITK